MQSVLAYPPSSLGDTGEVFSLFCDFSTHDTKYKVNSIESPERKGQIFAELKGLLHVMLGNFP